jgi:putative transposase
MQQNLFQRDEVATLMMATFQKYRDAGEYELHEYVVMPNHIHLLLSLNDQSLGRVIQFIKGGFSHALRQQGSAFGTVWQQRYYDRRVRDENEFAEVAEYIRQNPVRKGSSGKRSRLSVFVGKSVGAKAPPDKKRRRRRHPEGWLYQSLR